MAHTTLDGRILRCNAKLAQILGYAQEEVPGLTIEAITAPQDLSQSLSTIQSLGLGKADSASFEKRYVRKDGSLTWVNLTLSLQRDEQGSALHLIALVEDIDARKTAEERLIAADQERQASEARYRVVFETGADAVQISRMSDGVILDANQAFLNSSGRTREEVLGRTSQELGLWVDDADRLVLLELLREKGGCKDLEFQTRRKNGETYWVRLSASLIEIAGELCRVTFAKEITDVKAAEERTAAAQIALEVSEARYRTAFQTSLDVINITRIDNGTYVDVNQAFLDLTGYQRDEVIGRTSIELGIWADATDRELLTALLRFNSSCHDLKAQFRKKNGELIWGLMSASKLELDGVPCLLTVTRDVTLAMAAEERLARTTAALQLSETRYRTTFQTSLDAMMLSRVDNGFYIDVNQTFLDFTGYQLDEVIGKSSVELNIWADLRDREKLFEVLRAESICRNMDFPFRRKNGEIFWGRITAQIVDIDGVVCTTTTMRDITVAKAAEEHLSAAAEALRLSEAHYRSVFQTSVDGICISRMSDGTYIDANMTFLETIGYQREEIIGRTSLELELWTDPTARQRIIDLLNLDGSARDFQTQYRRKGGEPIWVLISSSVIEIEGVQCLLSVMRDITATKATEDRLAAAQQAQRATEARYRVAFETSLDAVNINRLSDGKLIDCNQAFLDIMGFKREEVLGRTSQELRNWADPADRERLVEILRRDSNCKSLDAQFRKKNGELLWGQMSASIMEVDGVPCILSITRDVSAAKVAEEEIRSLAFYDTLTQLPNRRLVSERLRQTLASSARTRHKAALLFIDLDDFKTLNDTLGHNTGDLMLQEVARRLSACMREVDTVARLGGDEFVVILEELSTDGEHAAAQAKMVAEKILLTLGQPYLLDGRECLSTSSVGITIFEDSDESIDGLLQQADIAMYQAKAAGRDTLHFFAPALQHAINARAALEGDLRRAIQKRQFVLFYQPQVDCCHWIGAEALIRWKHPTRGLLAPGEFIALAEESGLILPLGNWVLETACAQIAKWAKKEETARITISVNISARQFRQQDFVEQVLRAIKHTGADPQNLELELTESMLVDNIEDVTAKMTQLRAHGLRFSLDDFGTGYSSLAYLKRLPLTQLKIDRSFVRDILADASSRAIAQAVISLGHALGLAVIAEGVETEEQRDLLDSLGCHAFQGFLFSRPVPLDQFEGLLAGEPPLATDCESRGEVQFLIQRAVTAGVPARVGPQKEPRK
jgi:diguanylate cyclase (GGDEF)-like protein/PAS domain S-box-containing protein